MKPRIRYYDIAKGFAILAVIIGHSILISNAFTPQGKLAEIVYRICFTFHMPLFFILSGYFMHPERSFRWARESRELLATYGLTAAAIIFTNSVLALLQGASIRQTFIGWSAASFYGAGDFANNYLWDIPYRIGALWFLLGLFWAHLIVHLAHKTQHPWLIVLLCFIVGYWSARVVWLPFSIQSGLTASAFVYCGALLRRYNVFNTLRHLTPLWLIFALLWLMSIVVFQGFSMAMNQYGLGRHFVVSIFGAVSGTFCMLGISMLLDRGVDTIADKFARLGQNSLAILCAHILEDDTMPWPLIIPYMDAHLGNSHIIWMLIFACRLCFDLLFTWLLFHIPHANTLFFPYLKPEKLSINNKSRKEKPAWVKQ